MPGKIRNSRIPKLVALVLVVSVIASVGGVFSYPYLTEFALGPALKAGDVFIEPGFKGRSYIPEHGPETMGAKIWFVTGEMLQLPEDAYLSIKYDSWGCKGREYPCPTVPVYKIIRGGFDILVDGEGKIFVHANDFNIEYFRRFAFVKERLPPDRTPEYLDDLHTAYADEPCTMLKCEWW